LSKESKTGWASARQALLKRIDYQFRDETLLEEALTHPSTNTSGNNRRHNQRLEFLGDRVIGLIMADILFGTMRDEREGSLTRRYADCVENTRLAKIAHELDLGSALETVPDDDEVKTDKVLADALEALMGAVWCDGGMEAVRPVVMQIWGDLLNAGTNKQKDSKSRLQEFAMECKMPLPQYKLVGKTGPDHSPVFVIAVSFDDRLVEAEGASKREAEQRAASQMLAEIK
jgi:ribonuclease-3